MDEVKCFVVLKAHKLPSTVAIEMQDTKARREWRVSSLIDSGGQASMRMSIGQFRTAEDVNSMGEIRKKLPWHQ